MALGKELDQKTADAVAAQHTFRENPKVNKDIDDWIANPENANRWAYIQSMPLERIQRKLAYEEVKWDKYRQGKAEEVQEWVAQHPEVQREVQRRTRGVDPDRKKAAEQSVARRLAQQREITRTPGVGAGVGV